MSFLWKFTINHDIIHLIQTKLVIFGMVFLSKATLKSLPRNSKTDSHINMEKGTLFEVQHTNEITIFNEIHLENGCFFHCHVRFWSCNFSNGFLQQNQLPEYKLLFPFEPLIGWETNPEIDMGFFKTMHMSCVTWPMTSYSRTEVIRVQRNESPVLMCLRGQPLSLNVFVLLKVYLL